MTADQTRLKTLTLAGGASALLALTCSAANALPVSDAAARQACTADMAQSGLQRTLVTRGTPLEFGVNGMNWGQLFERNTRQRSGAQDDAGTFVERVATSGLVADAALDVAAVSNATAGRSPFGTAAVDGSAPNATSDTVATTERVAPTPSADGDGGPRDATPEAGRVATSDDYFEPAFAAAEWTADVEQPYQASGAAGYIGASQAAVASGEGAATSVPEPASTLLIALGAVALGVARRRRITR